jgi:hypothetical protein
VSRATRRRAASQAKMFCCHALPGEPGWRSPEHVL